MRLLTIAIFCSSAFSGGTICVPGRTCVVETHLKVPEAVSVQAARRTAGDLEAAPPVLILRGLEFGTEGFTIEVRAILHPDSRDGAVLLGDTGVVGYAPTTAKTPRRKIDLPIPLNEEASRVLANRTQIDITIKVIPVYKFRDPIKVDAIFLQPTKPQ